LTSFSEKLSARAARDLSELGVEIMTGSRVTEIDATGITLPDKFIPAQTVLWAAGVQASSLGKLLGVPLDPQGRVIVQSDLTPTGHPQLFVLGDTAHFDDGRGRPLPGLAPIAKQQGQHVGKVLKERFNALQRGAPTPSTRPFSYFDKGSMATIGRGRAVAQIGKLEFGGFVAWLIWLFIHILYLVGFKNRLFVVMQWVYGYMSFTRGARLIVGPGWRSFNAEPQPSAAPALAQPAPAPSSSASVESVPSRQAEARPSAAPSV
jgi:NADH dehydrogenase